MIFNSIVIQSSSELAYGGMEISTQQILIMSITPFKPSLLQKRKEEYFQVQCILNLSERKTVIVNSYKTHGFWLSKFGYITIISIINKTLTHKLLIKTAIWFWQRSMITFASIQRILERVAVCQSSQLNCGSRKQFWPIWVEPCSSTVKCQESGIINF